jgi:REP element-mobilizing transposase RayT
LGEIVEQTWLDLVNHNPSLRLHEFVVMPNHVHGIIEIDPADERVDLGSTPTDRPLSEIVRQFKSYSTRRINEYRGSTGASVWQRNYYEHIIRNEASHALIAQYIENNPSQWQEDELFVL